MSVIRRAMMRRKEEAGWWPIGVSKTENDFLWLDNQLATGTEPYYRQYNGWRASEPILVEGFTSLLFSASFITRYNYFYDSDGHNLSQFEANGEISVPQGARWMRLSQNMRQSPSLTITRLG